MPQYAPVLETSDIAGNTGFRILGAAEDDYSGLSVSLAGDVNGDGLADLMVGAPGADPGDDDRAGIAYIIYGTDTGFANTIDLTSLNGATGTRLNGAGEDAFAGWSVSGAGDVNGDGIGDMILGATGADANGADSGAAYVVFGVEGGLGLDFALSSIDGDNGFLIRGAGTAQNAGEAVSSAGDVNGDGFADLLVGAPYATVNGSAYVVFGNASGFGGSITLSALDGNNGFSMTGLGSGDEFGISVSSAGDVDGDGFDDIIVGARKALSGDFGRAFVVFGKATGWGATVDISALNGSTGFRIASEASGDLLGGSVSAAGDVNADGFADLLVGASSADPGGDYSGAAYVIFGKGSWSPTFSLTSLDGTNGFRLAGAEAGDDAGYRVASAGDWNGDGFDDVIVTAVDADPNGNNSGAVYVVFGAESGFAASIDLGAIDGDNGFVLNGDTSVGHFGRGLSGGGDLNGDGFDDIVVGASATSPNGADSGTSYVVFGAKPGEAVTRTGTAIDNDIHGGNFNDVLSGLDGDDTLSGHNGNDKLKGGAGGDTLFGSAGEDRLTGGKGKDDIDGGAGADRFIYGGASHSTSVKYDIVHNADFKADVFDLSETVTGIDAVIATGDLARSHFDQRLEMAVDDDHLQANHAVLFTPDEGGLAGTTFLIVDLNGIAGYQFEADLVVQLVDAQHLGGLNAADFV